jgi:peptidoglycan/LPS O-acetylase OafA/YrhL
MALRSTNTANTTGQIHQNRSHTTVWVVVGTGEVLLGYYSIWPFFVEIGLVLAIIATPLYRVADSSPIPSTSRVETLDGLRGFLALGVFFHHASVYQQYLRYQIWEFPPSHFHLLLGPAAVAVFFMITGFLFYSQLLKAKGRPNWIKLYAGRIFRIFPLYWFAVLLVSIGVGMHTGWHLNVSKLKLLKQIIKWGAGGVFAEAPINADIHTSRITAYVTWSLGCEWRFYLSLIAFSIPARWRWSGLLVPPILLCSVCVYQMSAPQQSRPWIYVVLFLIGMSVAAFRAAKPDLHLPRGVASIVVVVLLSITIITSPTVYRVLPVVILGAAFLLIASGADLFGLLATRPAMRLGNISYGIYLLQGPVLAAASAIGSVRALDLYSPQGHWCVTFFEAMALVTLATCTHVWIERPGIDLGRHLLSKHSAIRELLPILNRPKQAEVSV